MFNPEDDIDWQELVNAYLDNKAPANENTLPPEFAAGIDRYLMGAVAGTEDNPIEIHFRPMFHNCSEMRWHIARIMKYLEFRGIPRSRMRQLIWNARSVGFQHPDFRFRYLLDKWDEPGYKDYEDLERFEAWIPPVLKIWFEPTTWDFSDERKRRRNEADKAKGTKRKFTGI